MGIPRSSRQEGKRTPQLGAGGDVGREQLVERDLAPRVADRLAGLHLADGRILAAATRRADEAVDAFAVRIRRLGVDAAPSQPRTGATHGGADA